MFCICEQVGEIQISRAAWGLTIGINKLVVVVLVWKVASPHFNTSYQMILLKKSSKSVVKLIPSSSCWTSTRPQDKSMLLQGQLGW
jgi:hypothetical protein